MCGEGNESDFQPDDNTIPETEPKLDMGGFNFEIDSNLEQIRKETDKIDLDYDISVIDFNEFESDCESDDEQPSRKRNKRLKEIRMAYKGKDNIKEG